MDAKILEDVLQLLKKVDKELYDKFTLNKISKQQIYEILPALLKYINQKEEDSETTIEFSFGALEVKWDFKLSTTDNKISELNFLKNMYLDKNFDDSKLILNLNFDVERNSTRKGILTLIKTIIDTYPKCKGYWLWGDFGVGKTYISIMFLNYFAKEKKKTVSHILLSELISRIKSSFGVEGNSENNFKAIFDTQKDVDVLLIDDIGGEPLSEWARDEVLFPLLNYRMQNSKLTCFTSNLSINEYISMLDSKFKGKMETLKIKRLKERIQDLALEIELKGKNWRT